MKNTVMSNYLHPALFLQLDLIWRDSVLRWQLFVHQQLVLHSQKSAKINTHYTKSDSHAVFLYCETFPEPWQSNCVTNWRLHVSASFFLLCSSEDDRCSRTLWGQLVIGLEVQQSMFHDSAKGKNKQNKGRNRKGGRVWFLLADI